MNSAWAVIPVKPFCSAKTRLSHHYPEKMRAEIARAMFEDVLDAVFHATEISGCVVVTCGKEAASLAVTRGAVVKKDSEDGDLNDAVALGTAEAFVQGAQTVVVLPGDLPLLKAGDVSAILDTQRRTNAIVICPDLREEGTNALAVPLPSAIPFAFGPGSFQLHVTAIRAAGFAPQTPRLPRVGLDVDTFEDLTKVIASGQSCRTRTMLTTAEFSLMAPNSANSTIGKCA